MSKKSDYEKGWYDCYKSVRAMLNATMKEMVVLRSPNTDEVPGDAVSVGTRGRPRRGNGKEARA